MSRDRVAHLPELLRQPGQHTVHSFILHLLLIRLLIRGCQLKNNKKSFTFILFRECNYWCMCKNQNHDGGTSIKQTLASSFQLPPTTARRTWNCWQGLSWENVGHSKSSHEYCCWQMFFWMLPRTHAPLYNIIRGHHIGDIPRAWPTNICIYSMW